MTIFGLKNCLIKANFYNSYIIFNFIWLSAAPLQGAPQQSTDVLRLIRIFFLFDFFNQKLAIGRGERSYI